LRNNIVYGLENFADEEIWRVLAQARLAEYVRELPSGLATEVGDKGVRLSGGERQRVSIARALLKRASIIILDEATSALDSVTERLIQEAIKDAIKDKTAIVIAHRLSTIQHADRIAVVDQGRIVEEGSLAELLDSRRTFYKLWQAQRFY
jgi:ABC-type multidrug transport system fused ATPase/permease subunit